MRNLPSSSAYAMPGLGETERKIFLWKKETMDFVIQKTCSFFGVEKNQILKRCRKRDLSYCRQWIAFLLCEKTHMYQREVGEVFGFDRTTILYSHRKIKEGISAKFYTKEKEDFIKLVQHFEQ